jgi:hypothetical protein
VATSLLRTEALQWDTESGRLAALAPRIGDMQFGRLEAGIFQLMVGPYDALVQLITERCREGVTATADIAAALRSVADTYDAQDEATAGRLCTTTN